MVRRWSRTIDPGAGWDAVDAELDYWPAGGAAFWWRDDDAVEATPALDHLLELRVRLDLPLALAVIPALAAPSLRDSLDGVPEVRVLVHGWDHRDWAGPGQAKAELAACRSAAEVETQLAEGLRLLTTLFGPYIEPVLVPPFNQLSAHLTGSVKAAGFAFVSIDGDFAAPDLPSRNVHADLMDWSKGTGAAIPQVARDIVAALRLRRYGFVKKRDPIGIMTHHLAHDPSAWSLIPTLLARLKAHPAVTFPPIPEIFAP